MRDEKMNFIEIIYKGNNLLEHSINAEKCTNQLMSFHENNLPTWAPIRSGNRGGCIQDPLTLSPSSIPFKEELTFDFCLLDSFYLLLKVFDGNIQFVLLCICLPFLSTIHMRLICDFACSRSLFSFLYSILISKNIWFVSISDYNKQCC